MNGLGAAAGSLRNVSEISKGEIKSYLHDGFPLMPQYVSISSKIAFFSTG